MYNFPQVHSEDKIALLFDLITKNPVPRKFTYRFLTKLGLASSNDRKLLSVLRFLDIIDDKGVPTEYYHYLRDSTRFLDALSYKILKKYNVVFRINKNASKLPVSMLTGYFSRFVNVSENELIMIAVTFKKICAVTGVEDFPGDYEPLIYTDFNEFVEEASMKAIPADSVHGAYEESVSVGNTPVLDTAENLKELNFKLGTKTDTMIGAQLMSNENVPTQKKKTLGKLNLSINIPATTDERVYKTLFQYLKDLLNE